MDTDPILQRAQERRDAALREAREWEAFIERYHDLRMDEAPSTPVIRTDPTAAPRYIPALSGRISETERVAAEIIKERGRPVPTREILIELERRGVEVGGKEPFSTLSTRLSRASTIIGTRGIGWSLKEEVRQTNEAAGPSQGEEPAASTHASGVPSSEENHPSSPVKPAAGGGT